jgi:hypothetical protein
MRSATFVSILFFFAGLGIAACSTDNKACEPGKQEPCACGAGQEGFQVCEADGSAWGTCECACVPDCTGLDCGDDGCGGSCGDCLDCEGEPLANLCSEGACLTLCCPDTCESLGRTCGDRDDGCGGNLSCGVCDALEVCNGQGSCVCQFQNCEGVCCAEDEGCDQGACTTDDCCPGQNLHIWVRGFARDAVTQQGVLVAIAAGAPLTFLSGNLNTHVAETTASMSGQFDISCFDVANVSLGLILLADDTNFDGLGGDFTPTVTAVASFSNNDDKICMGNAEAMVLSNQVVAGLQVSLPSMDPGGVGFIIGRVVDSSLNPIAGATVERANGTAVTVAYPNADFTNFLGSSTSSNGTFVLPDQLSLTSLIGVRAGYTWDDTRFKTATIPGAAYWIDLVAN